MGPARVGEPARMAPPDRGAHPESQPQARQSVGLSGLESQGVQILPQTNPHPSPSRRPCSANHDRRRTSNPNRSGRPSRRHAHQQAVQYPDRIRSAGDPDTSRSQQPHGPDTDGTRNDGRAVNDTNLRSARTAYRSTSRSQEGSPDG